MNRYEFEEAVLDTLDSIAVMLMEKNESYGNAAIDPLRVFSKDDNVAQLKVRIDDKLSRIQRGNDTFPEDTVRDLVGYLVLLLIAETSEETEVEPSAPFEDVEWLTEDGLADWERDLLDGAGVNINPPQWLTVPQDKRPYSGKSLPNSAKPLEIVDLQVSFSQDELPTITAQVLPNGDNMTKIMTEPGKVYLINHTGATPA